MKKKTILALLGLVALLAFAVGCGEKEEAAETANEPAETATEAVETVATHDCDGGCGMKDVPMDQLTEVHGKYYCAGCAKKADEEHGHDHG